MGVTVLPPMGPSLGESLGSSLGQGLGSGLNMALQQMLQRRAQATQAGGLSKLLGVSPEEGQMLSQLDPKVMQTILKQRQSEQLMKSLLGPQQAEVMPTMEEGGGQATIPMAQQQQPSQQDRISQIATNPEAMMKLASLNPQLANTIQKMHEENTTNKFRERELALKEEAAERKKEPLSPEKRKDLESIMKRQVELVRSGHTGYPLLGPLVNLSPNQRAARSELNTLGSAFEATLLPMVNKGTLAKERFNYLMNLIVRPSDTDATALGKFKAFAREFKLDIPELKDFEQYVKGGKKSKKSPANEIKVTVRGPDGRIYEIPKNDVKKAVSAGGSLIR